MLMIEDQVTERALQASLPNLRRLLDVVAGARWDPDSDSSDHPTVAAVDRFAFPDGRQFLLRDHLPELPLRPTDMAP